MISREFDRHSQQRDTQNQRVAAVQPGTRRNFALREAIGRDEPPGEASHGKLADGAYTAVALVEMARERRLETPIAVAVDALLMRPPRAEA